MKIILIVDTRGAKRGGQRDGWQMGKLCNSYVLIVYIPEV